MTIDTVTHVIRISVVGTSDRIDAFTAPELRTHLDGLLAEGVTRFVLDLSRVPFLDSAGMAVLVSVYRRARQAGGNMVLVWSRADVVNRTLRLTRFDQVFSMADSVDAALQAL
jgi:anti-anti-sigma factor